MPLIAACQIPPPSNWQDLEVICADLWRSEWGNPTIQRHGRNGQAQHGVDISGSDKAGALIGIQCRCIVGKSVVPSEDIDAEIEKAKAFSPKLVHFLFATTGPKDAATECHCREKTERHRATALFTVTYYGWQDICELLQLHPSIAKRHYPFVAFSSVPLILSNETFQDWKGVQYSFKRPEYIHPRIVEELAGYISDREHTVVSVDLTAANRSNRFFGKVDTIRVEGKEWVTYTDVTTGSWFEYTHVGVSDSGVQIVWARDGALSASGIFNRILFMVIQRDTGLAQNGRVLHTRARVLLKILGSVSLGDRYAGKVRYAKGVLTVPGVRTTAATPYPRRPFSLRVE
jgi:hypothetical protein